MSKKKDNASKESIISSYRELKSMSKVCKKLDVGRNYVREVLVAEGISLQNHETFPEDDKILGYVCGLIATDGCLQKESTIIYLSLQEKDKSTIDWFYSTLTSTGRKARFCKSRNLYVFQASLPKLYQYCLNMGITPKKSLTLDVNLNDKSDEFRLYFFRGAIDGDGSVCYTEKTKSIQLASASEKFILTIQKYFPYGHISSYTSNGNGLGRKLQPRKMYHYQFTSAILVKDLAKALPKERYMLERKTEKLNKLAKIPIPPSRLWEYKGRLLPLSKIKKDSGSDIKLSTLDSRLKAGWSMEEALNTPTLNHKPPKFKYINQLRRKKAERWNVGINGVHYGTFSSLEEAITARDAALQGR